MCSSPHLHMKLLAGVLVTSSMDHQRKCAEARPRTSVIVSRDFFSVRLSVFGLLLLPLFHESMSAAQSVAPSVIRGRVLDQAGQPVSNVWVQVQTLVSTAPDFVRAGGWALASTNSEANG